MHIRKPDRSGVPTIEVFAGAGLLAHAFASSGARTLLAVEAERRARATLTRNVAPDAVGVDARDVPTGIRASLLVGGPPCQGFSSLGKRDATDPRNDLSLLMLHWARAVQPQVVVIENVPQFLESPQWRKLRAGFTRLGYEVAEWTLNAADFGAPQLRRRAFAVMSRIGLPDPPRKSRKTPRTVEEAFDGLGPNPTARLQHIAPTPSDLALARFKLIPPGGDKRDLMRKAPELCPPSWANVPSEATDVWGRMFADRPANTLRCSFQNASKGRYIHPRYNRVISLREGARLQGIPDEWVFEGDAKSIAAQIGNGVPIQMGKAVARRILSLF